MTAILPIHTTTRQKIHAIQRKTRNMVSKRMKEELLKTLNDYGAGVFVGLFTGLILSLILTSFIPSGTPSVQLVENKLQETKTVCVQKDIDWKYEYPEEKWEKLEKVPETGVIEKNNYSMLEGTKIWVTLESKKAQVSPPEKVTYHSVTECLEYQKIPKYSKVKVQSE